MTRKYVRSKQQPDEQLARLLLGDLQHFIPPMVIVPIGARLRWFMDLVMTKTIEWENESRGST